MNLSETFGKNELESLPARTWVEVDLAAIRHNCTVAQEILTGPDPKVLAVVKADGYGMGMVPVARAIQDLVRAFAVANVAEAITLRDAGILRPVYILGPALPAEFAAVVKGGFCPAVSTLEEVAAYAQTAELQQSVLQVHVVIDTGMGRIGALPGEAEAVLRAVMASSWLQLDSIASHFPCADGDPAFTRKQGEFFGQLMLELRRKKLVINATQLANSAALHTCPPADGGWVRAGLMLYGVSPVPVGQAALQRVATWKTRVTLVRTLPAGHGVSYGRTFITGRPTRTATLAVGYADGFPRQASGQGAQVLIGGKLCPVLGRVTMDQIIADVTDLEPAPKAGDEVVLVGTYGDKEITVTQLAEWGGTIAWDLFTGWGPRVRRIYRDFIR